ncbi:sporozoite antigen [Cyclospora cayetanensis]|uniref:Sporozoite antigen n=1 Tax=Cyclospora cayetanensis TaxID=88456 RepID=A0A1D3CXW3_9EIME|nr:sporozoite antigen [Cyclospora cayetanensis]
MGKAASSVRVGVEHLDRCPAEDRCKFDQGIDAGEQEAEYLLRGNKLALEAFLEGAKVDAARIMILVEGSKDTVLGNIPHTQEKLSQTYASFFRGYQENSRSPGYSASYQTVPYGQQHYTPYGAPPSSGQPSGRFFWSGLHHPVSRKPGPAHPAELP